jgi:hypothetical protein
MFVSVLVTGIKKSGPFVGSAPGVLLGSEALHWRAPSFPGTALRIIVNLVPGTRFGGHDGNQACKAFPQTRLLPYAPTGKTGTQTDRDKTR